jgi:hypothetical protein
VTVIAAEAPVWIDVPIHTGEIDRRPYGFLPSGTKLEIVGPYTENGACDLWPVLPLSTLSSDWPVGLWGTKPTDGATILIDERDIRPT